MDKAYEPKKYEEQILRQWEESGFCNPDNLPGERTEPFSIILPPPNATGTLHLGHAMMVVQDIMIRHARMQGKKTLYLPGTDHAAIATQSRVEQILMEQEGKTRHDLGREEFLRRVDKFVEESKDIIRQQLKKMGFSLDWSRECFTLDAARVRAVTQMFIKMADDGLVYRGDRIVNWDPQLQTTVADDEVEYKEEKVPFYYLQYGPFVIGTARPETKFADKVVVVHPSDERYQKYIGKKFTVPWINGSVEAMCIADEAADPELGTGAMTITPAHSVVDFEIAQRHVLERPQIIDLNGRLLDVAGEFAGMKIEEARAKIVEKLRQQGLLVRVDENYIHNLSVNYRGGGVIEPQIMKQWFVDVNKKAVTWAGRKMSLKEAALEVVRDGEIKIVPERFKKIYFHWMENLRDWCISRQLWYGHRIPAWYKKSDTEREHPVVQVESPGAEYAQDPDVLDTWFSAGMWTFSTLGWPQNFDERTRQAKPGTDLATYHPTSVLETGYDILPFWVARMILMTTYALGEVPFKKVYLHGLVRDRAGEKMSKSKGNGIDPLEMSAKYGTDAVRLALVVGTAPGNDVRLYEEKIAGYRNFVNKLWNVARYINGVNDENKGTAVDSSFAKLSLPDQWILSRLHRTMQEIDNAYEHDQYGPAADLLYNFVWADFADWYIELQKTSLANVAVQCEVLQTILKLLHPMIPLVTEAIAQEIKMLLKYGMLMVSAWPQAEASHLNDAAEQRFSQLQNIVTQIRNTKKELRLPPTKRIECIATSVDKLSSPEQTIVSHLARVQFISAKTFRHGAMLMSSEIKLNLILDDLIDLAAEKARLQKEINQLKKYLKTLELKLHNKKFLQNAASEIIGQTKAKKIEVEQKIQHLTSALRTLE